MKILLDLQNSMRAVTLNSEFSLCGLMHSCKKKFCRNDPLTLSVNSAC